MKHLMIAAACLLSAAMLAGCGGVAASVSGPTEGRDAPLGASSAAAAAQAETISYTVEKIKLENSASADDGTALAASSYEVPVLHAYRPDGSEITEAENARETEAVRTVGAFAEEFREWSDKTMNYAALEEMAREDYADMQSAGLPWNAAYADGLTVTSWQTEHLVSIRGAYYTYTGGAHPNTILEAWNFDLDAGAFIDPSALADDREAFQNAVTAEIIRQANIPLADGTVPAAGYWENYQEIAAQWQNYAVSFGDSGMTVSFSPYEMASYAAGEQTFTLSPDFLRGYLSDYGLQLLGLVPDA